MSYLHVILLDSEGFSNLKDVVTRVPFMMKCAFLESNLASESIAENITVEVKAAANFFSMIHFWFNDPISVRRTVRVRSSFLKATLFIAFFLGLITSCRHRNNCPHLTHTRAHTLSPSFAVCVKCVKMDAFLGENCCHVWMHDSYSYTQERRGERTYALYSGMRPVRGWLVGCKVSLVGYLSTHIMQTHEGRRGEEMVMAYNDGTPSSRLRNKPA